MDARQRIEVECADMQTQFERRIAINPKDRKAIDDLWRVQTLRYANTVRMTAKVNYGSQDTRRSQSA